MPGISIHVGVNATKAPGISVQSLFGCENDAEDMRKLARARQFAPLDANDDVTIIRDKATFENVLGKIRLAADKLVAGDTFLFTFSGHGTRRGAEDPTETDLKDETLVLHDKLLVDNVLRRRVWPKFKQGVRVVMVSDSCHSGGLAMAVTDNSESETAAVASSSGSPIDMAPSGSAGAGVRRSAIPTPVPADWQATPKNGFRVRTIPESQAQQHFEMLKQFYKELRDSLPAAAPPLDATVLLLAACEEFETTKDGLPNGVFTKALLDVLSANGTQTYNQLKVNIRAKLQQASNPVVRVIGPPEFADTQAFKV
jgi:uncharacterized caspase-like protein